MYNKHHFLLQASILKAEVKKKKIKKERQMHHEDQFLLYLLS